MNSTAVVILNYNGEKFLRRFLPSVVQFSTQALVIVADNGSTDYSCEVVEKEFPTVRLIKLDQNYGFCGGYNLALKQIQATYYVLLNSDVEVTSGWLDPLFHQLDKDKSIAAVQPKILSYHQRDHFEYAGAAGGFIDSLGYPFCRGRLFNFTERDNGQYNDTREIFWATGACFVVRSDIFHKLGGFDESFFAHMEEIELCWRIQRSGKKVFYCGNSSVYHMGAGTLSRSSPQKTYLNFRNALRLIAYHLPVSELVYKLPIRILLDDLAILKFLVSGSLANAWAIVRAHLSFIRSWPAMMIKRRHLRKAFPYSTKWRYEGSIVWDYFVLGKRVIEKVGNV